MKIVSLAIQNILKITAAFIEPSGDIIELKGDNAAGKSSVLDCIVMAFKGGRSFPENPIKSGADKGKIEIEIDGTNDIEPFTIIQSVTEKGGSLKIKPTKVLKGQTPRAFLDSLIGSVSFDPLEFINQDTKKQRQVLLELLGIDTTDIDSREQDLFDERTDTGRDLKTAKAQFGNMVLHNNVTETEEVPVSELSKELTDAIESNRLIDDRATDNLKTKTAAIKIRDESIPNIQKEIKRIELALAVSKEDELKYMSTLESHRIKYKAEKAAIDLIERKDIDSINEKIANIEETNKGIRENILYVTQEDVVDGLQSIYDDLDTSITGVRGSRNKLFDGAVMPVDGLSIDADNIYYQPDPKDDKIVLSQASDGQKLDISLAISMELNPVLKVIRMKEGSLVGPKLMKVITDRVKGRGYQLWIESVSSKDRYDQEGGVGIFIENGEITSVDGEKPKTKPKPESKSKAKTKTKPESKKSNDTVVNKKSVSDTDDW